jgi:hypothetical protein
VKHFWSFALKPSILQNAFHGDNISLNFYGLAHYPVQGLGDLKGIRHGQTDGASGQLTTLCHSDDREAGRTEDDNGAQELEPYS